MARKPGLPPSDLHLQTVADEKIFLTNKISRLLDHFESRRTAPSPWEGRQLDHAMDCVADGLFSLALCELDAITAHQRPARKLMDGYEVPATIMPAGQASGQVADRETDSKSAITLAMLRGKLRKLTSSVANP